MSVFFSRHNLAFKSTISRASFQNLIVDLLKKTIVISSEVIAQSKVSFNMVFEYLDLTSTYWHNFDTIKGSLGYLTPKCLQNV